LLQYYLYPCAGEIYHHFRRLAECDRERFYACLLDTKNHVIGVDLVSQGSLESASVHPREVCKSALLASASSVLFVHNHPSGDPEPSISDKALTKSLADAGKLLNINVLDHVIIGMGRYYSFANKSELDLF
jgi:DNA repair protein RadC